MQNQVQNQDLTSNQNQNQATTGTTNQATSGTNNQQTTGTTNQATTGTTQNTGTTAQNQNTVQASETNPWAASAPLLQSLIDQYSGLSGNTGPTAGQSAAVKNLVASAGALPSFGGEASGALGKLFGSSTTPQVGMLSGAFDTLRGNIGGTASGAELDPYSTPGFADAIKTATQDITDKVKGVYSASGRDPSGAGSFAGSLGRGLTQGIAPTIAAQYNQNKQNQLNAAGTLFGGAGSTAGAITGQQQVPLANAVQAMGLIPSLTSAYTAPATAALGAANVEQGLPFQNIEQLLRPALNLAGVGSSTSGGATTTGTGATTGTGITSGSATGTNTGSTTGTNTGLTTGDTTGTMTGNTTGATSSTGTNQGTNSGTGIGTATGNTTQQQSLLSNLFGGAFGLAGLKSLFPDFLTSDERAKTDIAPVGMLNDGQVIHRFRFKGEPTMRIGLLAQDVSKHVPGAVHKGPGGLLMVDHRAATDKAAAMEKERAA